MIQDFADWISFTVLHLSSETPIGTSVNFFIYDVIKIYFLIFSIVLIISFIRTLLSPEQLKRKLFQQKTISGNILASLLGAVTPFCSCSSIPIFIGFLKAKIPMGIAFSFLITSPLVNEVVFVLMGGTFGWGIAIFYALSGILLGIIVGIVIEKMHLSHKITTASGLQLNNNQDILNEYLPKTLEGKLQFSFKESFSTLKRLWLVIIIGVGIGAVIHGYVPQTFFEKYLTINSFLSVPLATLVGIPIYAGCSTVVPIAFALTAKGIPLGTSLAFMMSIAGLSLPEAIMLKKVLSMKLLIIFFSSVGIGIILIGYLFNIITLF